MNVPQDSTTVTVTPSAMITTEALLAHVNPDTKETALIAEVSKMNKNISVVGDGGSN